MPRVVRRPPGLSPDEVYRLNTQPEHRRRFERPRPLEYRAFGL